MKEKLKKIFCKISYLLEGIAALFLAINVEKIITTKYYSGYWSKEHLILAVIVGIITIGLIIFNLIKCKKKLEKIFLTFIIPIGLFYMIFMLPTYAPDESAHIWKAYEISQGYLFAKQDEQGKAVGVDVPAILVDAKQENLNKYTVLHKLLQADASYEDTAHLKTPAQAYPFVFYIPAAIAFFITRILNISIIYGLYIAKILNFIIFMIGGYYAIKKIPFGKFIIFTLLFMPMVLQQAVSISMDSIMNTVMLVYIVYTINLIFKKENILLKEKIIYLVLIILVTIAKMAYLPLIGFGFILLFSKNISKKDKILIFGLGTLICIILTVFNYIYAGNIEQNNSNIEENINSSEQLNYLLSNPIEYFKMIINTIGTNLQFFVESSIASPLGWLNIPLKQTIITPLLIVLIFSIFIEDNEKEFSIKQRIWTLLIIIGTVLIMITGIYLSWTPVKNNIAIGIQGRYFIPILPLILLIFSMKHNYLKIKNIEYVLPIILTILNGFVIHSLYQFFR